MSIVIGTWGIPLVITLAAFGFAILKVSSYQPSGGSYFPDLGGAILGLIFFPLAAIVSLLAWLIWALS